MDMNALQTRIDELTSAIEASVGNMDLKLLSAMLDERRRLLDRLAVGADAPAAVDLLRRLRERDAVVRSRLGALRDDRVAELGRMRAEPAARRRYLMLANNGR